MSHANQHFVPEFVLREWHTGPDARLSVFRWVHDGLRHDRHSAKVCAKGRHLWSMQRAGQSPDVSIERDFFGPVIDDKAASVHRALLQSEPDTLSAEARSIWSRFLLSLLARNPSFVEQLRVKGNDVLRNGLDMIPDALMDLREEDPEGSLRDWLETNMPSVFEDYGAYCLEDLVFSDRLNAILRSAWWVRRDVEQAKFDLIVSDRPLVVVGSLDGIFFASMPLSPKSALLVTNSAQALVEAHKRGVDDLVRTMNTASVLAAHTYVYATDRKQQSLVLKYLNRHS